MNGGDVYDLHFRGRAAVALLCPVTGITGKQNYNKMGEETITRSRHIYTQALSAHEREVL